MYSVYKKKMQYLIIEELIGIGKLDYNYKQCKVMRIIINLMKHN